MQTRSGACGQVSKKRARITVQAVPVPDNEISLIRENEMMKDEILHLKDIAQQLREQAQEQNNEIQMLDSGIKFKDSVIQGLEGKMVSMECELKEAERQIVNLSQDNVKKQLELMDLRFDVQQQKEAIERLEDEDKLYAEYSASANELANGIVEQASRLLVQKKKIRALHEQVESSKLDKQSLGLVEEALEIEMKRNSELSSLHDKITADYEYKLQTKDKAIAQMQGDMQRMDTEIKGMVAARETLCESFANFASSSGARLVVLTGLEL